MDNQTYIARIACDNEIEVLTALVQLYATSVMLRKGDKKLRNKLTTLLAYYIKYDYNKKTKEMAAESLDTSLYNINVMNAELTKMGFLVTSKTNFHDKSLNTELAGLKSFFESGGKDKLFLFQILNSSK